MNRPKPGARGGPKWSASGEGAGNNAPPWIVRHGIRPWMKFVVGVLGGTDRHQVLITTDEQGGEHTHMVSLWEVDGGRYFISGAGAKSAWVTDLRASGHAKLKKGRRVQNITVAEIGREEKFPVLRRYIEVAATNPNPAMVFPHLEYDSEEDLLSRADNHPVFKVT